MKRRQQHPRRRLQPGGTGNTANGRPVAGAGGIVNGGTAAIKASTVDGNTASGGAGGGILTTA